METQMADGDSHAAEFNDMALLDTASDDRSMREFIEPVVEVVETKLEDLLDVKKEPSDEYDAVYLPFSVKVCLRCVFALTVVKCNMGI